MNILLHRLTANNFKQLADVDLRFPDRCAFLIEGQNEAGKSSLFEAVYFALYGKTLISDRDYRIEHLKQYGADEMLVSLEFSVDGRPFSIARKFGKSNTARLVCPGLDGTTETITQTGEVNRRLAMELRLSSDAALNTCFVEQKKLEKLEVMDASVRRETINELLNLRILTNLEAEFKITADDRGELERLKRRVGIAELDARIPEIEEEVRTVQRCLLFAMLLAASAQADDLRTRIAVAAAVLKQISNRRAEVAQSLEEWSDVTDRVRAINTDLAHRLAALQNGLGEHAAAVRVVQELERLAAEIPARDASLVTWTELLDRLRRMERLEDEAARTSDAIAAERTALDRHDALKSDADRAEIDIRTLAQALEAGQSHVAASEEKWNARQLQNQRIHQLDSWLQQDRAANAAASEEEELRDMERKARQLAETLPDRQHHAADLGALGDKMRGRDDALRDRGRVEDLLRAARHAETDAAARSKRVEELRFGLNKLAHKVEAAVSAEQGAAASVRTAKIRVTLLEWAEASERSAESGSASGRVSDIRGKRNDARERLQSADTEAIRASRGFAPGLALVGLGIALLAALAVVRTPILAVVGALLLVAGGLVAVRSKAAVDRARKAQETARSERDTLEGELRAAEAQSEADCVRREEWLSRQSDTARRLEALAETPPADAASARARAVGLPDTSLGELDAALSEAAESLRQLRSEQEIDVGALAGLQADLARIDPQSLRENTAMLEAKLCENTSALGEVTGLQSDLVALGLPDEFSAIKTAVQQADAEVAGALAAEKSAAELGDRRIAKEATASMLTAATAKSARTLGLTGDSAPVWRDSAKSERDQIDVERQSVPDGELQSALDLARTEAGKLDRHCTRLETEHKQRQAALNARPRSEIAFAVDELESSFVKIVGQLDPLADTRPELARFELPAGSVELAETLAATRNELETDHRRAARLESALCGMQTAEQSITKQTNGFATAWKSTLPDIAAPADVAYAALALESARTNLSERAAELNAQALRADDARCIAEHNEAQRNHTGLERDLSQVREHMHRHRAEFGAGDELAERLPERFPELRRASEYTIPEWDCERDRSAEKLRTARSQRSVRAGEAGLDDEPMDLAAERDSHASEQKRQDVKRAGFAIVRKTRESIVNRVMPLTMHNMERLLPTLTDNRYSQAQWDEAENAITVYDNRARAFLRKRVFSGGARDQISLALRLSFALATLPGEHSVRPAWLFLDEPLSSFDRQRTQALVDLLTRGLIHKQFPQVFLISHSESFDPGQFDNRLRMEAGRITESVLTEAVPLVCAPFTAAQNHQPALPV